MRNFEIIGEAVKQLPEDLYHTYPEVSWRQIAGSRDVLIHNYMGVKIDLMWNVVDGELPHLHKIISTLLKA